LRSRETNANKTNKSRVGGASVYNNTFISYP